MEDTSRVYDERSSVYVAPLRIAKLRRTTSNASKRASWQFEMNSNHSRTHSHSTGGNSSSRSSALHFTPPSTPHASQESLRTEELPPFLRAFFPFQPTYNPGSSTVTLPLNTGDVILVHSIQNNGWADGTLLNNGKRGWLPTNYCENYGPPQILRLLRADYDFFELFRTEACLAAENTQAAVTKMVSGVRALLDNTQCLARDAPNVRNNERIAKCRKYLLADLSAMVKMSKRLPNHSDYDPRACIDMLSNDVIIHSFKLVVKAVRFLDFWYDQCESLTTTATVDEDSHSRATKIDDSNAPYQNKAPQASSAQDKAYQSSAPSPSLAAFTLAAETRTGYFGVDSPLSSPSATSERPVYFPLNAAKSFRTNQESHPLPSTPYCNTPRNATAEFNFETPIGREDSDSDSSRFRSPNSHHDRYQEHYSTEPMSAIQTPSTYALARLNSSHDVLLSYLGSYIGRLHIQARFTPQLQLTQQQSVAAAKDLLSIVEAVYERDTRATALAAAKDAMHDRIAALIRAARDVVASRVEEDDDEEDGGIMIHDGGRSLVEAATGCVRGAGECVAKSRFVIERIGDFELEAGGMGIGLGITTDDTTMPVVEQPVQVRITSNEDLDRKIMPPPPTPDSVCGSPQREAHVREPRTDTIFHPLRVDTSLIPPMSSMLFPPTPSDDTSRRSSAVSMLPIQPNTDNIQHGHITLSPAFEAIITNVRMDSISGHSMTNSTAANSIRGSEFSILSRSSTRATTPEPGSSVEVLSPLGQDDGRMHDSASEHEPVPSPVQSYVDELTYNKDGQVTGGTLRALVEKLTAHDSTPDAVFVSTFYLTFRLFATPIQFAEALVDRFELVTTDAEGSTPIRLRVYNVFKGWLESHWRQNVDSEALPVIQDFASNSLQIILPAPGKRLLELAEKASKMDGPLVPRLACGMGKNTLTHSLQDTPIPTPIVSRAQINHLRAARNGSIKPSFLDFDPLEIARQLTLKESRMFCNISPEELLAQEWAKKKSSIATNVLAMSSLSTDLAHLVAESILDLEDSRARARVIKHWIKIADRCLELNNYDTLMAIMCTLNTSTIVRLKKTWELVSVKTKQILAHLRSVIDVSKNHAVLRSRLRNHVPPCLPFLGTYLTDLTFIDVGNPSKRPLSTSISSSLASDAVKEPIQLINFDKHVKTAKVIYELQRFQIPYRFTEIPEMQEWINTEIQRIHESEKVDVQKLYRRSLLLEPREVQRVINANGDLAAAGVSAIVVSQPPPLPTPAHTPSLVKETSKSDLFSWAHMFKTNSHTGNPSNS